jgi:hypothetical protein
MTVTLKGQYKCNGRWEEVVYQRYVRGIDKMPAEVTGPLQDIYAKIKDVAMMAGATALSISVQGIEIPRDQIEIEVHKKGEGVHVIY